MTPLELLSEEADRCREQSIKIRLWWRDDDLIGYTEKFARLMQVSETFRIPILVAVIPGLATGGLDVLGTEPQLAFFCQHGWKHVSHEPTGCGKSEFGPGREPLEVMGEIVTGRAILIRRLGERCLPVFVPPWNTFHSVHQKILADRGFTGLSCHGRRDMSYTEEGIRLANTHVSIGGGSELALGLDDILVLLAKLIKQHREMQSADPEVLGLLTHHRVMSEDAWAMMDALFATLATVPGISWVSPPAVFAKPN